MKEKQDKALDLKQVVRTLHSRNYRLFFSGQGLSLIGTWMQQVAVSWLVYRLTDSTFILGLTGFAGQFPVFLLAPFTGVLADRWNKHRMLIIIQSLSMLQAAILAFLVLTHTIQVWSIVCLSIMLGLVNAFDTPVRQSFIIDIIDRREDLGNAIALNSAMFNGARLIGPALAGILIAGVGEGFCFLINAFSFLAVLFALTAMKIKPHRKKTADRDILHELKEGFRYAFNFLPIRYILLFLWLISLMSMSYTILMPAFARDILHGGPHTLGFLMSAAGIGALSGAIFLASKKTVAGLPRIIPLSAFILGIGLCLLSQSRSLPLSMLLMLFTVFGIIVQMASSNTLLQTLVDDDKRGRVMSFYAM
ncbi:MAG: MFS transporter, partial [bacterium]|nr:MFS transporter [bacterium]